MSRVRPLSALEVVDSIAFRFSDDGELEEK